MHPPCTDIVNVPAEFEPSPASEVRHKPDANTTLQPTLPGRSDPGLNTASDSLPDKSLPNDPFFLEICAGSARVTTCLQQLGLKSSFGVDHKRSKNAGRVLIADLTHDEGKRLCWQWLSSPNCVGVFCAPPGGTCSRARGIPIRLPTGRLVPGPKPLRSDLFPDGFATLSGTSKARVDSANCLYAFVTEVCLYCIKHDMIVCIENPRQSLYWRTSFFKPLSDLLSFTVHQACAYGSERPKWTVLAHNTVTLHSLNQTCPGVGPDHRHKPWGMTGTMSFSTSEETAYPMKLAYSIAFFLVQQLVLKGWKPPMDVLSPPDDVSYQYLRSIAGVQPKASKIPPLVSEFESIIDVEVPFDSTPPVAPGEKLQNSWHSLPAGACLLKKFNLRSNGGFSIKDGMRRLSFGIFGNPAVFVEAAVAAGHPVTREAKLPNALEDAVTFLCQKPPRVVADHRLTELKFWLERAKCLESAEAALHATLDRSLQDILAPKRLLLWKEMLGHYQYPDCEVFSEVTSGIRLSGPVPIVQSFEPCFKPAKMTEEELASTARASRIGLLASVRSSGSDFIDEEVYKKTLAELESGWLSGPYEPCDLPTNV